MIASEEPSDLDGASWIPLVEGTGQLAVRETFFDRRSERPAELRLELLGEQCPPVLDPESLVTVTRKVRVCPSAAPAMTQTA